MKTDKQVYKKEIEMVLLGELPELEETQSGKDRIRIGEERGERRGEQRGDIAVSNAVATR